MVLTKNSSVLDLDEDVFLLELQLITKRKVIVPSTTNFSFVNEIILIYCKVLIEHKYKNII